MNDLGKGAQSSGGEGERGEGDYAVVFSPAVPLPPELLRACARYAGCGVWTEENAVLYASDTFVALHTAKSGEHVIHLPGKTDVWDCNSGRTVARQRDVIRVNAESPATHLFRLGNAETLKAKAARAR